MPDKRPRRWRHMMRYRFQRHLRHWGHYHARQCQTTLYGWQGEQGFLFLHRELPPGWPNPYWVFAPGKDVRFDWNEPAEATV